jgi:hypothetical protein
MTISNLYPTSRPSLSLNFARVKALDPRITFARASAATYYDADGVLRSAGINQARFDHLPVSGESLGLLIEEQRTNLFLNSGIGPSLTNWATSSTPPTITFDQLAPDGSNDAILLDDTSTTVLPFVRQLVSVPNDSTTYTCSFYAKAGSTDHVYFRPALTGGTVVFSTNVFNFTTRTFSSGSMSPTYQDVGNGWVRISFGFANNSTGNVTFDLRLSSATGISNVESTGTVYLWGAQLEASPFSTSLATSYIKTEASQVTRLADNALISGDNFSSWYNQDQGTVFVDASAQWIYPVNTELVWLSANASIANRIRLWLRAASSITSNRLSIYTTRAGGDGPAILNFGIPDQGTRNAIAFAYTQDQLFGSKNGLTVLASPQGALPKTLNTLHIGSRTGAAIGGHIRKISYYPTRIADSQLQALTR